MHALSLLLGLKCLKSSKMHRSKMVANNLDLQLQIDVVIFLGLLVDAGPEGGTGLIGPGHFFT